MNPSRSTPREKILAPRSWFLIFGIVAAALGCRAASSSSDSTADGVEDGLMVHAPAPPSIELEPCSIPGSDNVDMLCGSYEVYEDREARSGRTIALNIAVLPAVGENPRTDPVFYFRGGPGGAATGAAGGFADSWMREERDIVLVDQRGTGGSNPLDCELAGNDDNLQGYLEGGWERPETYASCREQLEEIADLELYTTPIAMDDVDEVREALGYDQINVYGGSYGSRAVLVYLRRHPQTVRTAMISGIAPLAFTNPLYHSYEAQRALELTFEECANDTACNQAFPNLSQKFDAVIARLESEPAAAVTINHPAGDARVTIELDRQGFAEGLRVFMYYMPRARRVPLLIHRAWEGDYEPIAEAAVNSNRGIRGILKLGMLMSVVCSEDIPRIDPSAIPRWTDDTFLGDTRVREQMAACATWPRGKVPSEYGEPVSVDNPVLVLSGTLDPVTGPRWGDRAVEHLPNSLHVVAPGAHGVSGPCIRRISRAFLTAGSVDDLDTSCVADMELPPFQLSEED